MPGAGGLSTFCAIRGIEAVSEGKEYACTRTRWKLG